MKINMKISPFVFQINPSKPCLHLHHLYSKGVKTVKQYLPKYDKILFQIHGGQISLGFQSSFLLD